MVLGKLDRYMQKNKTRPPSYTTHKNKFKMVKDLNVRLETIKVLEKSKYSKVSDTACSNFYDMYLLRQGNKRKNNQMGL